MSSSEVEGIMLTLRLRLAMLVTSLLLAGVTGCGFQLRGAETFPVRTVHVQAPVSQARGGEAAPVVPDVIRGLERAGVVVKPRIEEAEFSIRFNQVLFDKRVLSLSGGGRAREFELEYLVRYEFVDARGRAWGEPGEITIRRDFSFAESQALAKEAEERQLVRDMQLDAAAQILRRLTAVKPPA
ncbi:MAG: LPS assembly lipoprotein LptE [Casimicrobiaceae bacterium]